MKPIGEIQAIKKSIEQKFLKRQGIVGVDIGFKYVKGKKTDEISIRVLVEKKGDVPKSELIPATVEGVKTDVIERRIVLHPVYVKDERIGIRADTASYAPLVGGISIGPCRSIWLEPPDAPTADWYLTVGTLGVIVRDNTTGNPMMLSNFHVMCVDSNWSAGDAMVQPSRVDGGSCSSNTVGTLNRGVLGGQVDCAVADITTRGNACEIAEIGSVAGTATATLGAAVRKRGRTTGLTYGTVDSINLTVNVPYPNGLGTVTFADQIGILVDTSKSTQFGTNGDSGSVVVNTSNQVIGLYFAGTEAGDFGVSNPIDAVFSSLNVSICSGKPLKELIKEKEFNEKNLKELMKEKEFKEFKEKDIKEFKDKEKDRKEKELKEKEFKEKDRKEFKEKDKDIGEKFEIEGGKDLGETQPIDPIENRISRLEKTIDELTHFISSALRPDLGRSALGKEPDVSTTDLSEMSRRLKKQAEEAKQAKDNKDYLREY